MSKNSSFTDMTKQQIEQDAVTEILHEAIIPEDAVHNENSLLKLIHDIMQRTYEKIDVHNQNIHDKTCRWKKPCFLTYAQTAELICSLHTIKNIDLTDGIIPNEKVNMLLAVYDKRKGIYVPAENIITSYIIRTARNLSPRAVQEITDIIREKSPIVVRTKNKDLIAVNNGIFNYHTKMLMPFDPTFVYLSKCTIDYDPNAGKEQKATIQENNGRKWNIENWINSLSDDPEKTNLLWQILGAVIRPNNEWRKIAYLNSEIEGYNNDLFCNLAKNLCKGQPNYCLEINCQELASRDKEFMLKKIPFTNTVIGDNKNHNEKPIDTISRLNDLLNGSMLILKKKYKNPTLARFHGIILQSAEKEPKIRDKSEHYSGQYLISIQIKNNINKDEYEWIKEKCLCDKNILQYVLYKTLHMPDYYELKPCGNTAGQASNAFVLKFCRQMLPRLQWDFIPFRFLYELYQLWLEKEKPGAIPLTRIQFTNTTIKILEENNMGFFSKGKQQTVNTNGKMEKPEMILKEYDMADWMDANYSEDNPNRYIPPISARKQTDRGILRIKRP